MLCVFDHNHRRVIQFHACSHVHAVMSMMPLLVSMPQASYSNATLAGPLSNHQCCAQLHFLPHFKTVPEPPSRELDADYVRTRDVLQRDALHLASYNTMNAARRKQAGLNSAPPSF